MGKKVRRSIIALVILITNVLAISTPATVLAQSPPDTIDLVADHSKLEGTSRDSFEFEVKLNYNGSEARSFDLNVEGPKDWIVYITPTYPKDKKIKDIWLEPIIVPEKVLVYALPPVWLIVEPGNYEITLEASSDGISNSITLQAIVTSRYALSISPTNELYSTKVVAGKDNNFSLRIDNLGTDVIHNIVLSSDKPEGWRIEFTNDRIDALEINQSKTVDVIIRPSNKAIAGDYQIILQCSGKETSAENLKLRVTVQTSSVWGWVGVIIILVVGAGLAFIVIRFSRR